MLASLYNSPGFNLPGQPVADLGNLTPSVPNLAGSHQVSSTWLVGVFTGPSSPHLTVAQANSLYKLATECQALGIELAKKFQMLWGLEAMHRNSIQGTMPEMLTLGHSAWEAAYFAIIRHRVPDDEHEATTRRLRSKADVAWKEMHEVMYNHQLHYDGQLTTFLADAELALSDMRGKVWDAIRTLVESEGISKSSTCSHRFPSTFHPTHKYPSLSPTARNLLFIKSGTPSRVAFHLSARKSGRPALCPVLGGVTSTK